MKVYYVYVYIYVSKIGGLVFFFGLDDLLSPHVSESESKWVFPDAIYV